MFPTSVYYVIYVATAEVRLLRMHLLLSPFMPSRSYTADCTTATALLSVSQATIWSACGVTIHRTWQHRTAPGVRSKTQKTAKVGKRRRKSTKDGERRRKTAD